MSDVDYSKLSDEELAKLAGEEHAPTDVSQMTDEQLHALANQPQQVEKETPPHIPPVVAGGAAAWNVGVPAAEWVGGATLAKGIYDIYRKDKGAGIANAVRDFAGMTPAQKWNTQMHGVDLPHGEIDKGSFDIGQQMKQTIGPGGELQGGNIRGGIMIGPEAERQIAEKEAAAAQAEANRQSNRTLRQKVAEGWNITKEKATPQNDVAKLLLKKPLTAAKIIPGTFGAGYNAADLYNRAMEGNVPQATIAGVGTVGSVASMVPKKGFGKYGTAAAIGAPLVNAAIDYLTPQKSVMEGHAAGGAIKPILHQVAKPDLLMKSIEAHRSIKGYSDGKLVKEAVGLGKKGYDLVKGYLEHTPQKPHPEVGTRYERTFVGDLAEKTPFDPEKHKGKSILALPWDSTNRGYRIESISGNRLINPYVTEGGQDWARDIAHMKAQIGGASGPDIAKRVQKRADIASRAAEGAGGTGEVFYMPVTMGEGAENFSSMPIRGMLDLMQQRELNPSQLEELSNMVRTLNIPKKGQILKNFVGFNFDPNDPRMLEQMTSGGHGLETTPGELRKGMANRLGMVQNQKLLGYNLDDLTSAITDPSLVGTPKGFSGNTFIEAHPGAKLKEAVHTDYPTAFSGVYTGSTTNMPIEYWMPEAYKKIYDELAAKYPHRNPNELRTSTIGALEKRNEGVSQVINNEVLDNYGRFQEGLKSGAFDPNDLWAIQQHMTPDNFAEGGEVKNMAGGKLTGGLSMLPMTARTELRKRGQLADRQGIPAALAMPDQAMVNAYNSAPADLAKLAAMYAHPAVAAGMGGGQMLQGAAEGDTDAMLSGGLGMLGLAGSVPKGIRAARGVANTMMQNPRNPVMADRMYNTGAADDHLQAVPAMAGGGDVVKSLIKKALGSGEGVGMRTIEGSPHTYPPIAEGPWMRDYQSATQLPTTRQGWDDLAEQTRLAQSKAEYALGRTGPNPHQPIQYMGKYQSPTPERMAAEKAQREADIRTAIENRKAQWLAQSRARGIPEEQIMEEMNSPWGAPWMP